MKAKGIALSDVGRERENNEDAFWLDDELGAYVVCDGMGGHASGETASRVAVESVAASVRAASATLEQIREGAAAGHTRLVAIAEEAVEAACREVHALAGTTPEHRGMGCTLTLLLVANDKGAMAHVGDTRLYLQRDGGVDQLSSDHTMAADFVRRAKLTPEAARTHRYSSALTRAIGPLPTVEVETLILDVLPDDVFLLCSDGLTQHIASLGELAPYLAPDDLENSPKKLVDLANERGGGDNITALAVGVRASESRAPEQQLDESVRNDLTSLRTAELFSEIPFAHLLRIYAACEVRDLRESEPVLSVGDEVLGLYCVLSGSFQLEGEDGVKQELTAGDTFAGPALLVQGASHAKLSAAGGGRLLFLDGDRFRQLAAARPRIALTLLSRMAQDAFTELERNDGPLGLLRARKRLAWWNPLAWARIAGWTA